MNKKQLIGKYKNLEGVWDAEGAELARRIFLQDLEQLDEPQKPVVPQFVADWYEKHKNSLEFNIFDYVYRFDKKEKSDLKDWFNDINTNPFQTLFNMHQFGYEVEEEKRYIVKIKAVDQYLVSVKDENFLGFLQSRLRSKFTRKELEDAGFSWVFDCEGVEVEEVEE